MKHLSLVIAAILISSTALAKKKEPVAVEDLTDRQVCKEIILHEADPPAYWEGHGWLGAPIAAAKNKGIKKKFERYSEVIIEEALRGLSCPRPNAIMIKG
ncbi:MAG: hypothetical protein ABGY96_12375 [bacterium]|nr:hypothetical protein [Gammaproteobacteria bacterium]